MLSVILEAHKILEYYQNYKLTQEHFLKDVRTNMNIKY